MLVVKISTFRIQFTVGSFSPIATSNWYPTMHFGGTITQIRLVQKIHCWKLYILLSTQLPGQIVMKVLFLNNFDPPMSQAGTRDKRLLATMAARPGTDELITVQFHSIRTKSWKFRLSKNLRKSEKSRKN